MRAVDIDELTRVRGMESDVMVFSSEDIERKKSEHMQ